MLAVDAAYIFSSSQRLGLSIISVVALLSVYRDFLYRRLLFLGVFFLVKTLPYHFNFQYRSNPSNGSQVAFSNKLVSSAWSLRASEKPCLKSRLVINSQVGSSTRGLMNSVTEMVGWFYRRTEFFQGVLSSYMHPSSVVDQFLWLAQAIVSIRPLVPVRLEARRLVASIILELYCCNFNKAFFINCCRHPQFGFWFQSHHFFII